MKGKVIALVLISTIICLMVLVYFEGFVVMGETQLRKFSSYEELKDFVKNARYYSAWRGGEVLYLSDLRGLSSIDSNIETSLLSPDYSKTNTQEEGVDEADIVKTDGEYIYIISGCNVTILKAYPPEEAEILSQIKLNGTIRGLFINGDKMVILEDGYNLDIYYATFASSVKSIPNYSGQEAFIRVYDVSNRANPISKRNVTLDGYYFDSRMIGDYVYAVINGPIYVNESWVSLPKIYSNTGVQEIDATEIYYSSVLDYFNSYTTIVAINTQNDAEEPTYEPILLGATSNMYVSINNIYITFQGEVGITIRSGSLTGLSSVSDTVLGTTIHRVYIENGEIEYVASGHVQGRVLNQFSMDEYDGCFRIATTTGQVWSGGESASRNHVYVLDMDLNVIGKLENLAYGEKIYSARFMGNRCYLVTYKKTDPLFVIDLSNPYDPRVLGQLKVTGYSDYLHPYDENYVIGVGKEAVEVEDANFAWYQGVKISLFDVSDVEHPKEIDKYVIGDRGTDSPVLKNHKAFLFDRSKGLLVIPVLVAEVDEAKYPSGYPPNTYGDFVFQGAYVFDISLSEGLVLRGRITHLNATELMKSGYYFDSPHYVERSLCIDNVLYTISSKKIKMNSLDDLAEINEIELP